MLTNSPAVVPTNSSVPSVQLEVSILERVPKVYIVISEPDEAVSAATPNAGIFDASSASAKDTTVLFPLIPDI